MHSDDPNCFGDVVSFINTYSKLAVLSDASGESSVAVWPAMQGRVMASTAAGPKAISPGWVNRELIASGKVQEHMNAVGGEDRLWLGPEGGQFSIFFAPGVPFDLEHWYTPAALDTEPFDVVDQGKAAISLRKAFCLQNYSSTQFDVQIDREVRLLTADQIWRDLGIPARSDVKVVGYESDNRLTNTGRKSWSESSGLLSLWVLGQFQALPKTTIVLPIRGGLKSELGIPARTDYFGAVPEERIHIAPEVVMLKADGRYRCKLGLSWNRAKGILGSYDARNRTLTLVQHDLPPEPALYVNSEWKIQEKPFGGDAANCYNDGPPAPEQAQLGQFYELESSSPARALAPGESLAHTHRTIHLTADEAELSAICTSVLGVDLHEVQSFNP